MALRSVLKRCWSFPTVPCNLFTQRFHLSSSHNTSDAFHVELLDPDMWQMSSCLFRSWRSSQSSHTPIKPITDNCGDRPSCPEEGDSDSIDSMRIRGDLFYKLEKNSKEFEEWNLDFHRRNQKREKEMEKTKKREKELEKMKKREKEKEKTKKREKEMEKTKKREKESERIDKESLPRVTIKGREYYSLAANGEPRAKRSPTFNQVTGPYHEPFSLDIFVSRSSISAAVVHRASSKVVAVAHSISKDIKCDLTSTKNIAACALIGRVLASRALADDIHDVIYTPRRGDKIEGKLKIVLESIMENGVNVKVKIKQKQRQKPLLIL